VHGGREDGGKMWADPRTAVHDDGRMAARAEQFRRRRTNARGQSGQFGAEPRTRRHQPQISFAAALGLLQRLRPQQAGVDQFALQPRHGRRDGSGRRPTEQMSHGISADAFDNHPPSADLELCLVCRAPEQPPRRMERGGWRASIGTGHRPKVPRTYRLYRFSTASGYA
jgi:hypothetical protein